MAQGLQDDSCESSRCCGYYTTARLDRRRCPRGPDPHRISPQVIKKMSQITGPHNTFLLEVHSCAETVFCWTTKPRGITARTRSTWRLMRLLLSSTSHPSNKERMCRFPSSSLSLKCWLMEPITPSNGSAALPEASGEQHHHRLQGT